MKRLISVLLVALVCLSLVACGGSTSSKSKLQEYVDKNGTALCQTFETAFASSSGFTCSSSIKVEGDGFVITIKINELDEVPAESKKAMQDAYDSLAPTLEPQLAEMQKELPEIKYFSVDVCEKDGDHLATLKIGK